MKNGYEFYNKISDQNWVLYKNLLSNSTPKNTLESESDDFLFIKADRKFYKINHVDILFIEGLKDYVVIHTKSQKLITAMNLKTIHQKISTKSFIRVSKSYVVNTDFIDSFDNHTIFINENEVPIGEVYRANFISQYSNGLLDLDQ